jgi:elongation factor Ts
MQVAATSPAYVTIEDVPEEAWVDLAKDTIRDLVREQIGKLGENIVVRRFARFEVGAGSTTASEE